MTKARRGDSPKAIGLFPDESLLDALAKCMDEATDGVPQSFEIIGKRYIAGDMQRPVCKFHGRTVKITTDTGKVVEIAISEA
eukprot:m.359220 g.359220  ORF g.359220 m.359220 type:complete len:82 (+) comp18477_c0_seq1:248-493(+)